MQMLLTVTFWLSVFLLRLNVVGAVECPEMIIKFDPRNLSLLSNCTSILGSLSIASIEDSHYAGEVNKMQFPKLKEITGFLLLFNVKGLTSVGNLFPNLTVIRGKKLFRSYSLIIFSNPHLTKVDLKSLISIQRGYVLIERCATLCYHNTIPVLNGHNARSFFMVTSPRDWLSLSWSNIGGMGLVNVYHGRYRIDWEALTEEDEDDLIAGKGNIIQVAASKCPTNDSCRACEPKNCWSAYSCQKNKQSHSQRGMKGVTCHELCLGGCVNGTAEGCNVCSKLKSGGTCVDECPSDLFVFRDTMRCITKQRCMRGYRLIPFNGECRRQCPVSYSQYHPVTNEHHPYDCFKCKIKCPKRCLGLEVLGPTELEYYRECTIVDGSMSIRLELNLTDIYERLDETLGNIETINGVLKIYRSFSLTSLSFFRNLVKINAQNVTTIPKGRGEDADEVLSPYALEITENDNLQTLFNWKEKHQLEITGGGMSVHFNAKLCVDEISMLQNITNYNRSLDSIGLNTNGYDEACHATGIVAFHVVQSHSDVRVFWNISDFGSDRRLVGYFVYYIEAPARNMTYFYGLDACSTKKFRHSSSENRDMPMISKKSSGDIWQSVFVPFEDLQLEEGYYQMNLTGLKQYTQYAYYVRTQLSLKQKDQVINVTQGQSQVKYFKTLPDRPRPPIVRTRDRTNVSLTLEWIPSTPEVELVEKYFIDVYALIDDEQEIDQRNYCRDPKVSAPADAKKSVIKTPEVICCADQRAYLEFFQRDVNQSCGVSDPSCEKTYEFVLFHHHIESALLMADSGKDPSERYRYKHESYQLPTHHRGTVDLIKRKDGGSDARNFYLHSHIIDDKHTDHVLVTNLKPFNLYGFHVYACNKISNCSDYYFHSDRTHPYRNADDVSVVPVPDELRSDIVTMIIQPPAEPNGVTVAYEIKTFDYTRNILQLKCVTRKAMQSMNYTIRSLSLGDDGHFSDWVVVEVEKPRDFVYIWGLAMSFICIALIVAAKIVYSKWQQCISRRRSDVDFLLSSRRDSEISSLQQSAIVSELLEGTPPEDIQMSFFRANSTVSTSNELEPITLSGGMTDSKLTTPSKSLAKRVLRVSPKEDDSPDRI